MLRKPQIRIIADLVASTQHSLLPPEFWPVAVGIAGALAYMLAHGLVDHGYFLVDLAFAFHLLLAVLVWMKDGGTSAMNVKN